MSEATDDLIRTFYVFKYYETLHGDRPAADPLVWKDFTCSYDQD